MKKFIKVLINFTIAELMVAASCFAAKFGGIWIFGYFFAIIFQYLAFGVFFDYIKIKKFE